MFILQNSKGEYIRKVNGIWKLDTSDISKAQIFSSVSDALTAKKDIYNQVPMCGLLHCKRLH